MSASRFYAALAALLFTAVSAWAGAALFGRIPEPEAAPAEPEPTAAPGSLRGMVLRWEQALSPEEIPAGAADGERLSAAESGLGSGLFFAGADGYEYLTPADAQALTPEKLDRLLAAAPRKAGAGRLVTGRAFFCAAFLEGGGPLPEAGDLLRLRPKGLDRPITAEVVSAAEDAAGRRALLLRLTEGEELLGRTRFLESEIIP